MIDSIDIHRTVRTSGLFMRRGRLWSRQDEAAAFEMSCNGWVGFGQVDMRGRALQAEGKSLNKHTDVVYE